MRQELHVEFHTHPIQTCKPVTTCPQKYHSHIEQVIAALVAKGAIVQVTKNLQKGFLSTIFLVPKKDGKMRPVINLRDLNSFITNTHFKMEGMRDLMLRSDWMTHIDLKDTYFAVPIHQNYQRFLHFTWENKTYQFTCLPFGLSTAPRIFIKLLKPAMAYLRSKGVRSVVFIDDILLMGPMEETVQDHKAVALDLLEALGFLVNYPESQLMPTRKIEFLGFQLDSSALSLSLLDTKVRHIKKESQRLLQMEPVN